jgi:hypothetical protein
MVEDLLCDGVAWAVALRDYRLGDADREAIVSLRVLVRSDKGGVLFIASRAGLYCASIKGFRRLCLCSH